MPVTITSAVIIFFILLGLVIRREVLFFFISEDWALVALFSQEIAHLAKP